MVGEVVRIRPCSYRAMKNIINRSRLGRTHAAVLSYLNRGKPELVKFGFEYVDKRHLFLWASGLTSYANHAMDEFLGIVKREILDDGELNE